MSVRGRFSVLIVTALVGLGACAAIAQAQASIGELAPSPAEPYCVSGPYENIPGPGASLATYTIPTTGVLTSWSTLATEGAGQTLTFKVYRRLGEGSYTVVGHDGPRELVPNVVNTFKTAIPVQAGDVIGNNDLEHVEEVPNACEFETTNFEDVIECSEGEFLDGEVFETIVECENGSRPNVTATILPPPTISSISPAGGSVQGGTSVVIVGANFAEVKGVTFGTAPAAGFAVNSEGQITAIAPPSASPGHVSIAVTTLAGTAVSPTPFAYEGPPSSTHEGCVVPKLKGKKLKAAKRAARKADCAIGKVKKRRGATAKTGKVVKQRPKPGTLLPPGTKIRLVLG